MAAHDCGVDKDRGPFTHLMANLMNEKRPLMKPKAIFATVLTEDFGSCIGSDFNANRYYKNEVNTQKRPYNGMINIQMLGDYNLECYMPEKDITMINFPLEYWSLKKNFEDINNVIPTRERKCFAHFMGSLHGGGGY